MCSDLKSATIPAFCRNSPGSPPPERKKGPKCKDQLELKEQLLTLKSYLQPLYHVPQQQPEPAGL
jgi:hypothetical protein